MDCQYVSADDEHHSTTTGKQMMSQIKIGMCVRINLCITHYDITVYTCKYNYRDEDVSKWSPVHKI